MAATVDTNTPAVPPVLIASNGYNYKGFNTTVFTKADVTAATAWTTANSPVTIFTVTGAILCRVYGVTTTALTSAGPGTGTLALGITGTTGLFIAATTANGSTNFILDGVWVDNAPTVKAKQLPSIIDTWVVLSNANVILTVATNNMTAGGMNLYCDWLPLTAGATVV